MRVKFIYSFTKEFNSCHLRDLKAKNFSSLPTCDLSLQLFLLFPFVKGEFLNSLLLNHKNNFSLLNKTFFYHMLQKLAELWLTSLAKVLQKLSAFLPQNIVLLSLE